jgi:hypothetical protein
MFSTVPISSWNEINETLHNIGTSQTVKIKKDIAVFLIEIELINGQTYKLTERGISYFRTLFILKDEKTAESIIVESLLNHSIVSLIIQVFFGRGPIDKIQMWRLLTHHDLIPSDFKLESFGNFLALLNKYKIIRYDKKNGKITITHESSSSPSLLHYFVSPTTPFSNRNNLRKIIRESEGKVYWVDKHFRKEGFELIIDAADGQKISSLEIISGNDNVTNSATQDYQASQTELSHRGISMTWWVCNDPIFLKTWHDRWIIADNHMYNIPPVLSIIRGQQSEMLKTTNSPNINAFLRHCNQVVVV